jgi:hypothetical protein
MSYVVPNYRYPPLKNYQLSVGLGENGLDHGRSGRRLLGKEDVLHPSIIDLLTLVS